MWLTVCVPKWPWCFHKAVLLLSCHPISIDCWLLSLSTPMGSFSAVICVCVCVCVCDRGKKKKSRLRSPRSPAASHVWIEARCFEMLKSQPVRCQTVRHTQNSLVHSRIHSFSSFFPSFSHSCCLSISFRPVLEKCGPPLPSQRFQTEYKVCNSNKLVVKGEKKNLLPITPAQTHFLETWFLRLCHHRKPALMKSEPRCSLDARARDVC